MFADAGTRIYPPEGYSHWWWVVVGACLLGIALVLWWARRALRRLDPPAAGADALGALKSAALARIDEIERRHRAADLTTADFHQRLSGEVRRFAGTVTGGDADYRVLTELRRAAGADPRLEPVVRFVADVEAAAFAPSDRGAMPDPSGVTSRAREVVERWS